MHSQREAAASSLMNGVCDNFLNAFAIHLRASVPQIAWLTAIPQLLGAWMQLASVWMGMHCRRQALIVVGALSQALAVLAMALLAALAPVSAVTILIALAILYHGAANIVQPQWRAWMGGLVPERRRGRFFATRTRIVQITSFSAFLGGGLLLHLSADLSLPDAGFAVLFLIGFGGRATSAWLLSRMHDPVPRPSALSERAFHHTWQALGEALRNRTFRNYTLFVAGMQCMVSIAAPFFSVYMLRDLGFSYWQFTVNTATSILVQFLTLRAWGQFSDHLGNRVVMIFTSLVIPMLPVMWIAWDNFWFLVLAQAVSGLVWSGFSLSTANFLYDLRPHHTHFATYAAVQAGLSATGVFLGAMTGGYLAAALPTHIDLGFLDLDWQRPLYGVFALSALMRLLIALWFIPRAEEPRVRRRPRVRELVYRIARYTPITGVMLDWMTVTRRRRD